MEVDTLLCNGPAVYQVCFVSYKLASLDLTPIML